MKEILAPFHFFGIYEAILILIIGLEPPFDLILRSVIAHDTDEKYKLFQADHTVTVSVKSIKKSLKILRCPHDSKLCDHAEELALVQVTHLTILPLLQQSDNHEKYLASLQRQHEHLVDCCEHLL